MSSIFSCNPGSVWAPFDDPIPEELKIIDEIILRINEEEKYKTLEANMYEKKKTHIKRFLQKNSYNIENTLYMWSQWILWRHKNLINEITEEEIEFEKSEGVLAWRGNNKEQMNCLVITGRLLDPINRKGSSRSFKRYIIKTIEQGLESIDDNLLQDKLCIIYDRRGLEFQHIDPNLFQFCKPIIEEMQDWYGDRLGAIYVLHINIFFWILYNVFIYPTMSLINPAFNKKFILLDKLEDLLVYFDEDQLLLNTFDPTQQLSVIEQLTIVDGTTNNNNNNNVILSNTTTNNTTMEQETTTSTTISSNTGLHKKVDPTFDMSR